MLYLHKISSFSLVFETKGKSEVMEVSAAVVFI